MTDDEIKIKFQGFHKRVQQIESSRKDAKEHIEKIVYTFEALNRSYDRSFENINKHLDFLHQLILSKDRQINALFEMVNKLNEN